MSVEFIQMEQEISTHRYASCGYISMNILKERFSPRITTSTETITATEVVDILCTEHTTPTTTTDAG